MGFWGFGVPQNPKTPYDNIEIKIINVKRIVVSDLGNFSCKLSFWACGIVDHLLCLFESV